MESRWKKNSSEGLAISQMGRTLTRNPVLYTPSLFARVAQIMNLDAKPAAKTNRKEYAWDNTHNRANTPTRAAVRDSIKAKVHHENQYPLNTFGKADSIRIQRRGFLMLDNLCPTKNIVYQHKVSFLSLRRILSFRSMQSPPPVRSPRCTKEILWAIRESFALTICLQQTNQAFIEDSHILRSEI